MIPTEFIDELINKIDIVDIIEEYVPLKKSGANYTACCPFHKEKSPSFSVSPSKQFYHCFGCGAHGSAIGFIMEYQSLGISGCSTILIRSHWFDCPQTSRQKQQSGSQKNN